MRRAAPGSRRIRALPLPPETTRHQAYRGATLVFGVAMVAIGIAMVVGTVTRGGGPLSLGVLLGLLFAGLGIARLYILYGTR